MDMKGGRIAKEKTTTFRLPKLATDIQKMEKFNIILKSGTVSTINS